MTAVQRKQLQMAAKLNAKGDGIIIKKLPATLIQKYADYEEANYNAPGEPQNVRNTLQALRNQQLLETIRGWARGGIQADYLMEITQGMSWVKHANFVVAFKARRAGASQNFAVTFEPVGFVVYGTFNPERSADNRNWFVRVADVPNDATTTAEVEVLITKPGNAYKGVGRALLEYAIGDVMARKARGTFRYQRVLMFSNQDRMVALATDAQRGYGFVQKNYTYRDGNNNNITNQLVAANVTDPPASARCYVMSNVQTAVTRATDRVVSTDVCPRGSDPNKKYWQLCQ